MGLSGSGRWRQAPLRVAVFAVLALVGLAGCAPQAEPTPTPTAAFASEEEAFAAAEETYRAYNDAGNAGDDAADYLTGAALDGHIETQRYLKANDLSLVGDSVVISFAGMGSEVTDSVATIRANICLDVSASRLIDANGVDVTPSDRADRWLLEVTFVGDSSSLLISDSSPASDRSC